jgi:hypothetical protein
VRIDLGRFAMKGLPLVTATGAIAAAERFLNGFRCDAVDLFHALP